MKIIIEGEYDVEHFSVTKKGVRKSVTTTK